MRYAIVCLLAFAWGASQPLAIAQDAAAPAVRFVDVSQQAGLAEHLKGAFVHAVAWGDFDNDGLLDLFVGTFADRSPRFGMAQPPRNMLFRQVKGGSFERVPCPAVEVAMRCSGAVWADLDNDGDLDLYVTSNTLVEPTKTGSKVAPQLELSRLYRNDGEGRLVDVSQTSGACPPSLVRARDIAVLDYNGDGLLDLLVMQDKGIGPKDVPVPLHLFRNLGGLKFANVAAEAGLAEPLWGAGVAVADLNGDRLADFFVCGSNRLFLSGPDHVYREAAVLRPVFNPPEGELDWVTGASFGDLDRDGDLDLATGRHHYYGPSRIHVYQNISVNRDQPAFREITRQLGLAPLPQKAPHPEIQDFNNDAQMDLYWSAWFARGESREPFLCWGRGLRERLPQLHVPATAHLKPVLQDGKVQNVVPASEEAMVYYVNSPAVDYDNDGDLDLLACNWPDEPCRLFRNETRDTNWLKVQVVGRTINRQGIGARVGVYRQGMAGQPMGLLGVQEITLNGGYSSSRAAVAHFGLGDVTMCDVVVQLPRPAGDKPIILPQVAARQTLTVRQP